MTPDPDRDRHGLRGRVALVTGGASGIGRGAVDALRGRGATVVLIDSDPAALEATTAQLATTDSDRKIDYAPAVLGIRVDVTSTAEVAAAVGTVTDTFGRLDILVTAAGIQRYGDAVTTTEYEWNHVLAVNLTGPFHAVKHALPLLRRSPAGAIVVVSSVQAFVAQGNASAYGTSKGALTAFVRTLAIDEARYGLRANAVCPGSVDTPMLRASARQFSDGTDQGEQRLIESWGRLHPLGRVATPREIGEAVAFLASDEAAFVSGVSLPVDGGLLASVAVAVTDGPLER